MASIEALRNTPVNTRATAQARSYRTSRPRQPEREPQNVNHYDVQPTYDVYVNVSGRDLGGVAGDVQKVVDKL